MPQAVVLPEPWRPAIRITVGGLGEKVIRRADSPISAVSSSFTIFTTCWPGLRLSITSLPSARSLTAAVKRAHDLEVDVRLEQREADLAHRLVDVVLVQLAARADVGEHGLELVGEGVEHGLQG